MSCHRQSEAKGEPGGNPEPGDWLRFVFVFVACVGGGRGEAASAGEGQSVPAHAGLGVGMLLQQLFAPSKRSSGRGSRIGFDAKWTNSTPDTQSLSEAKGKPEDIGFVSSPFSSRRSCECARWARSHTCCCYCQTYAHTNTQQLGTNTSLPEPAPH